MAEHKSTKKSSSGGYKAKDITVLEGLEPVRRRPGMYIGTTSSEGLHHLVWEVFDNGRDEAMGGFANDIEVALLPGNRVRVVDNGRGIPVDVHAQTKVSALETIMTTLHAGGKFGGEGYKVSGGLHGVGVSVVNALSLYTQARVYRDGGIYVQEYSKGKRKKAVKNIGSSKLTGTVIVFEPDPEIFKDIAFDFDKIVSHMRQQAYLARGLKITVIDARGLDKNTDVDKIFYLRELNLEIPSMTFYFEGGLLSFVRYHNRYLKPVHKSIFYIEREQEDVHVEVSLQYVDDISSRLFAFANNIYNAEGGMHMTGFKTSLTRTVNAYAKKNNIIKDGNGESLSGDDVLEGLTAVISVKLREIQFEGQTKGKLGSVEARGAVETVFGDAFSSFLEENPEEARFIIGKVLLAQKARKAAKAAKDSVLRKGVLEGLALPGKLADCQTKNAEEAELFVVEGDSAGGSGKQGRDRRTQAILPLWGKVLNVERARLDKIVAFRGIKELIIALGTAIGDTFDISKLRYHKIIIATDADVDGAHIRTLLLTLFYRYFRPIIDGGYLYIAQPPLYKIKKGKEVKYAYSDAERDKILGKSNISASTELQSETEEDDAHEEGAVARTSKVMVQRYKGLGEMNPDELRETTMDPERRVLKKVTIEDAEEADTVFDILMGTEVAPRKSFIQTNAKLANLDV